MKHFAVMSNLENSIYEIDKVRAQLRLLSFAVGEHLLGTVSEDVQIAVSDLNDRLEDSLSEMKNKFYQLWEDVREDSFLTEDDRVENENDSQNRWGQIIKDLSDSLSEE